MNSLIESLVGTTVQLDEGGYGFVFSFHDASEGTDNIWCCHICDVKGADEMSLRFHIQCKLHSDAMQLPSHPGTKFTNFEQFKEENTETDDVKDIKLFQPAPPGTESAIEQDRTQVQSVLSSKPSPLTDDVKDIKLFQPAPPGTEFAIETRTTHLQSTLESCKTSPLIGAEFLVELTGCGVNQEPEYYCMLCDKRTHLKNAMAHLTGIPHRLKYMRTYFPTIAKNGCERFDRNKFGRKQYTETLARIIVKLGEKFGHLYPSYVVNEENFQERKQYILQKILEDKHFKETPSETFLELLDEAIGNNSTVVEQVEAPAIEQGSAPLQSDLSPLLALLDNYNNKPLVGMTYILELIDDIGEFSYFCTLCDKQGDDHCMLSHLVCLKHRLRFMKVQFPKTKHALKTLFRTDKGTGKTVTSTICGKIEAEYGRETPIVVTRMTFENNRDSIIRKTTGTRYFRESLDKILLELVSKEQRALKECESNKPSKDKESMKNVELVDLEDISEDEVEVLSENVEEKGKHIYKKQESIVESLLKDIQKPFIGLEYLVELTSKDPEKQRTIVCTFCNKRAEPTIAMNHFTSYKHCSKYINLYFPKAKTTIFYMLGRRKKDCKKELMDMIMVLCGKIREKYGWLKSRMHDEDYFERNKKAITAKIAEGEHFRETPEENFVAFVEETINSLDSFNESDAVLPNDASSVWTPPQAIGDNTQFYDNQFYSAVPGMSVSPAPGPISSKTKLLQSVIHIPPATQMNLMYTEGFLSSGQPSERLELPLQEGIVEGSSRSRSIIDWENSPLEISTEKPKSPCTDGAQLSPTYENLEKTYGIKYKKLEEDISKEMDYYKEHPEKHPMYKMEWEIFCTCWFDRRKAEGKSLAMKELKSDFFKFWEKKVKELLTQKFETLKQELRDKQCDELLNSSRGKPHEEDRGNKRKERSNSGTPPSKRSRGSSSDKVRDRSEEKHLERRTSKEKLQDSRSRDKSRERSSREESRERSSREKSEGRRSRERRQEKERCEHIKVMERESSRDRAKEKRIMERSPRHDPRRESPRRIYDRERESRERRRTSNSRESSKGKISDEERYPRRNSDLISVLRIVAALEDQLGSLGPPVIALLTSAISLEKIAPSNSEALLANPEHFLLLDTVKEKLKGQLFSKIVERYKIEATKECVNSLKTLLANAERNKPFISLEVDKITEISSPTTSQIKDSSLAVGVVAGFSPVSDKIQKAGIVKKAESPNIKVEPVEIKEELPGSSGTTGESNLLQKTENLNSSPALPAETPNSSTPAQATVTQRTSIMDEVAVAKKIATALIEEKIFDITKEELKELIRFFYANQSSFTSTSNLVSQIREAKLNKQDVSNANTLADNEQDNSEASESSSDPLDYLSMQDITNLFQNFEILLPEEQEGLIKYLAVVKHRSPEKFQKLQESLDVNSLLEKHNVNQPLSAILLN